MTWSEVQKGRFAIPPSAVLFDLDGTLADTKGDLATAVNRMRRDAHLPPLALDDVVRHIGRGARNLVAKCLAEPPPLRDHIHEARVEEWLQVFRKHYDQCLLDTTVPFDGIPEMLADGLGRGIPMAVVSNKPEGFSRKILAGLGLADHFYAVVGGDTLPRKKPDPDPVLHALAAAGAAPEGAVMVGDSETDLNAGLAAGCRPVLVSWGLRGEAALREAGAETIVGTVGELARVLWGPDRSVRE